jgi:hypothetical protein
VFVKTNAELDTLLSYTLGTVPWHFMDNHYKMHALAVPLLTSMLSVLGFNNCFTRSLPRTGPFYMYSKQ